MTKKRCVLKQIAFVGNYLPRQCGIATFTTDLCESMAATHEDIDCFAVPVNDTVEGYNYPPRVRFELQQNDLTSFQRAAEFLNMNNVDLLCLQHEYGIFGGPAGSHILALLREARMPCITTLHTVLSRPTPEQRQVMNELAQLSDRLVVMSQRASMFLQEIYKVPARIIDVIPHGIPDVPFVDPNFYKDQFGVEGKVVLQTFGLLSPNKGIEHVISALPQVLSRYPNVAYMVVGTTHPHVKRQDGETYRRSLHRLTRSLGLEEHVIFYNRFVSLEELVELIGAADIYITPYLAQEQIVSGTLSYTVGAGKAVISTPYWYAEELLTEGRGILVPFGDPNAIAEKVLYLLENESERHAMRKRAYLAGREMIWAKVARLYMRTFEKALEERARRPRAVAVTRKLSQRLEELPLLKLDHLHRLTDETGMLQHAVYTVPNYHEGYTTDDNARALYLMVLLEAIQGEDLADDQDLASRFLAFLWFAFNKDHGRFHNFLSYTRCWQEEVGTEDSHGRALWGLGTVVGRSKHERLMRMAAQLFASAVPSVTDFTSPRAWAYTLIGIHEYMKRFAGDRRVAEIREALTERLLELYHRNSTEDWPWFEDILTYNNARMPHALLICGADMGREDMVQAGLAALGWLVHVQKSAQGHFAPIGNRGFYPRNGERALFDQQPLEAHATISACLAAYRLTKDEFWYGEAQRAFDWFFGHNDLGLSLYDPHSGGCRDGLHADRVNENQGAESTLAFLLSTVEMRLAEHVIETRETTLKRPAQVNKTPTSIQTS